MDRMPGAPSRLLAVLVATAAATAGGVLVPTAAQAVENVRSSYNVGCTLHPDQGNEFSEDPGGVTFDGERNDVTVSPLTRTITASSTSVYPADATTTGEDCGAGGDFSDLLTVGAGTSGLTAGDTVPVQVSVVLDGEVAEGWDADGHFLTRAEISADVELTSQDDCEWMGEGYDCERPLDFFAEHEHYVYSGGPGTLYPNGYVEAQATRQHSFRTNTGVDEAVYLDESRPGWEDGTPLCDAWPCDSDTHRMHPDGQESITLTGPAELVVGHRYDVEASLGLFTQGYDNVDVFGSAVVREFSFDIAPAAGFEGVELAFASAGGPAADTTAPDVDAEVSPPAVGGWHTTPVTVTVSAADAGSGVESITYGTTGALTTPSTVVEGDSVVLTIGTDGVTDVTFQATDLAGNVSVPQTLTVRLDSQAPVVTGADDLTVPATGADGARVSYAFTATDNLGGPLATACTPASGSTFPIGTTPVTCTVTDEAGNAGTAEFDVTVTPLVTSSAMDRLGDAIAASRASGLSKLALTVAYRVADSQFDAGRTRVGCALLSALDVLVRASGRSIPPADATAIRNLISEARAENGC